MLRASIFAATILVAGCRTTTGPRRTQTIAVDDRALRVSVAHAEARRADGVTELVQLATSKDPHARELALRGLGRVGGAKAFAVIHNALVDPEPRVIAAALSAIAVAGALDDKLNWASEGDGVQLLAFREQAVRAAAADALGHAGSAKVQAALAACVATGQEKARCALALGTHGRRKLKLAAEARQALVAATSASDRALRFGAVYALAREHEPQADAETAAALVARIADDDPEIRAIAISGLAKHKAIDAGRAAIEAALHDADWRVAVEAVRALANADDAGREVVAGVLQQRYQMLVKGDAAEAHVIAEALRAQIGKATTSHAQFDAIYDLGGRAEVEKDVPALARGWIGCLVRVAMAAFDKASADQIDWLSSCALPDHLKLPLLADLVNSGYHDAGLERATSTRAASETDLELSTALYELIGGHQLGDGAAACRAGLSGHPLRVKAALECLRQLGEPAQAPPISAPQLPADDVASVIGHSITWHLETSRGTIEIALRPDVAPWAVASIVALTRRGFYDGIEFHRVVPDFVVQGGDPTSSGYGGPGYLLPAEPVSAVDASGFQVGGVGMADSGPDSAGSQWFIMHGPAPYLDARYTWIGSVVSGQKVADALMIGDRVEHATVILK